MSSLRHLDLNLLKAFDVLMDERSVTRAAASQARVMRQMPVIHKPVGRHVLAHRRHRDTITQLHVF